MPSPRQAKSYRQAFPFGEVITPDHDTIGNYLSEAGRTQLCVDETTVGRIEAFARTLNIPEWKMGPWVCSRVRPADLLRVSRTRYGWRVLLRVPRKNAHSVLSNILGEIALLFPDVASAIAAAEIFSRGPHPDIAPVIWIGPGSEVVRSWDEVLDGPIAMELETVS